MLRRQLQYDDWGGCDQAPCTKGSWKRSSSTHEAQQNRFSAASFSASNFHCAKLLGWNFVCFLPSAWVLTICTVVTILPGVQRMKERTSGRYRLILIVKKGRAALDMSPCAHHPHLLPSEFKHKLFIRVVSFCQHIAVVEQAWTQSPFKINPTESNMVGRLPLSQGPTPNNNWLRVWFTCVQL